MRSKSPLFYPVTVPTNNVAGIIDGSHGSAPNYGATFGPGPSYAQTNDEERDTIANLHFALPHAHDEGRDDLQLLYSVGEIYGKFLSSVNDLGGEAVVGAPAVPYLDGYKYTGPVFAAPNAADLQPVYFPFTSTVRASGSLIDPNARDTSDNSSSVAKLQYQHNGAHSFFARPRSASSAIGRCSALPASTFPTVAKSASGSRRRGASAAASSIPIKSRICTC